MAGESSKIVTGHGPIYEALKKLANGRQDSYYRELGKITSTFARIEAGTTYILGVLSGLKPEIGFPLIEDMSIDRKLKKLRQIIPHAVSDKSRQKRIADMVARIDDARIQRNKFAHSIWYLIGRETGLRYDSKARTQHLVTLEELIEFNDNLKAVFYDLLAIEKLVS